MINSLEYCYRYHFLICNKCICKCICLEELQILSMRVNVKKSCIVRKGKSYNSPVLVSDIIVGENPLPWGKSLSYLGVCFMAGKDIKYDFHETKSKYFGALNCLFGKIGAAAH